MPVQVWVRAMVMAAATAVILLVGGREVLAEVGDGVEASARPVAVVLPPSPTDSVYSVPPAGPQPVRGPTPVEDPDRGSPTGSTPGWPVAPLRSRPLLPSAHGVPTATTVSLSRLPGATAPGVRHAVVLRGTLLLAGTRTPVVGPLTLWRKARGGRWTPVLTGRVTGPDGTVRLTVSQSAPRGVYRLTLPASVAFRPAASAILTVGRG